VFELAVGDDEIRIEDILGEIRAVMLSMPCPYCGHVPKRSVKPGEEVECKACGLRYTIKNVLSETGKEVLRKIVEQVLQKYSLKLEKVKEDVVSIFVDYANQTLCEIREFYERFNRLPTKSDLEQCLSDVTNKIMKAIADGFGKLHEEHKEIRLIIESVNGQVKSIKGSIEEIFRLLQRIPFVAVPSREVVLVGEARIVYKDDKGQLKEVPLPRGETVIGRDPYGFEVQARMPSGTLGLGIFDATVSRRHLRIFYDGKTVFVEDLGSTNGTRINGEKLRPHEKYVAKNGDEIIIGASGSKLTIKFLYYPF